MHGRNKVKEERVSNNTITAYTAVQWIIAECVTSCMVTVYTDITMLEECVTCYLKRLITAITCYVTPQAPGDQEKPRSVPSLQYVSELMSKRDMSSRAHVTYTVRDSLVGNYLLPRPSFCLQSILVQLKCLTWFKLRRTVIHVKYGNVNLPITNENTRETNILISQQNVTRKNNQFERVYILFRGSLEVIWLRKSNFDSPTVN